MGKLNANSRFRGQVKYARVSAIHFVASLISTPGLDYKAALENDVVPSIRD